MAVLTGVSASAWSSPTLVADSTVSSPFVPGVRHGADPDVQVNSGNSGFLRFALAASLPTDVTGADINKATLKLFISTVNRAGKLSIRRVSDEWKEASIPVDGIAPALDLVNARPNLPNPQSLCRALDRTGHHQPGQGLDCAACDEQRPGFDSRERQLVGCANR